MKSVKIFFAAPQILCCAMSSFSDSMFWVEFYATHGAKKQQLTPFFLIIKNLPLVFYGLVCDQLSRNSRAKACISTAESHVARSFRVLFARKLLEE